MTVNITSKLFTIQYTDAINGEVKSFYFGNLPITSVITLPSAAIHILDWGFVNDNSKRLMRNSAALLSVPPKAPEYVTNFYNMFRDCRLFKGDGLGTWDMTGATSTRAMFFGCSSFVKGISNWDVSNVTDMSNMFDGCKLLNDDLSKWDVSKVKNFSMMFYGCISFNHWIGSWDISSGTDFSFMFYNTTAYNQDLTTWDVLRLRSRPSDFDTGTTSWETNNKPMWGKQPVVIDDSIESGYVKYTGKDELKFFKYKIVSGVNKLPEAAIHISNWGTTDIKGVVLLMSSSVETVPTISPNYVTSFENMFNNCSSFNDPNIVKWDVSHITSMSCMFGNCTIFNQPLDKWDVSNNKDFRFMFQRAISYNQDLSSWDVSHISEEPTDFARDVEGWVLPKPRWGKIMIDDSIEKGFIKFKDKDGAIGKVAINFEGFTTIPSGSVEVINWGTLDEVIDQPITVANTVTTVPKDAPKWTTSFKGMFKHHTTFNNPNVCGWDVSHVKDMSQMFYNCKAFNQDIGKWDVSNVENMDEMFYKVLVFDQDLSGWNVEKIKKFSCSFSDADITGTYFNGKRWPISKLPVWGTNGGKVTSKENTVIHILEMYGGKKNKVTFEYSESTLSEDRYFLNTSAVIIDWGYLSEDNKHLYEEEAGRVYVLSERLLQVPKVRPEGFTNFSGFFNSKPLLNDPNISKWDMKGVKYINDMFEGCTSFNQPLNEWDVSDVLWFSGLFRGCTDFNQDIGMWDVSNGENFYETFKDASSFNQDLSYWNVVIDDDENIAGFDDGADSWVLPRPTWQGSDKKHPEAIDRPNTDIGNGINYDDLNQLTYKLVGSDEILHLDTESGIAIFPDHSDESIEIISWGTFSGSYFYLEFGENKIVKFPSNFTDFLQPNRLFMNMDLSETDFSNINTKSIKSMYGVFEKTNPNDTIKDWDVSHITDFSSCFEGCRSNPDISKWDVSSGTTFTNMFMMTSNMNSDITNWNTESATNMVGMFNGAFKFNQDLSGWNVDNVPGIPENFDSAAFAWTLPRPKFKIFEEEYPGEGYLKYRDGNSNIRYWKIDEDTAPGEVSFVASEILDWGQPDESVDLEKLNRNLRFHKLTKLPDSIPKWITTLEYLIPAVIQLESIEPLASWDVSHITDMTKALAFLEYVPTTVEGNRKDLLSNWDVSNVKSFKQCFESVSMEGVLYSIKDWDVSSCENFQGMFLRASFVNYIPIHFWNVKNAKNMEEMFSSTEFNIDLSTWDVEHIPKEPNEFSIYNNSWDLPKPLWGKKPELAKFKSLELLSEENNVLKYKVITNFPIPENLTVNDAINVGEDGIFEVTIPNGFYGEFKLVLKSNDSRYVDITEFSHTVELPELGVGELLYKDNTSSVKTTSITFDDKGVFTLPSDVLEVIDWGTINDDPNLKGKDLSIKCPPTLTKVPGTAPTYITSMNHMFESCVVFKGEELATWTVTNITSMKATFKNTKALDVDLSKWSVSNVTDMEEMFMNSNIKY